MEYHDPIQVMWREGTFRCEHREAGSLGELRLYVSDILRYREPVLNRAEVVRQAANLFRIAQAAIGSALTAIDDAPARTPHLRMALGDRRCNFDGSLPPVRCNRENFRT